MAYRCQGRQVLMQAIANHAPTAELRVLRGPGALRRFVAEVTRESRS
jgi:ribosomal protein S7